MNVREKGGLTGKEIWRFLALLVMPLSGKRNSVQI